MVRAIGPAPLDPAAAFEIAHGVLPAVRERRELNGHETGGRARQRGEEPRLHRRALWQPGRVRLTPRGGDAPADGPRFGVASVAQEPRQRRRAHFARGMLVVAGGPLEQRHEVRVEQGLGIEDGKGAAQACGGHIGAGGERDHDADTFAFAKRHEYPLARAWGRAIGRREIVERLHDRRIDRDPQDTRQRSGERCVIYPQLLWIGLWMARGKRPAARTTGRLCHSG